MGVERVRGPETNCARDCTVDESNAVNILCTVASEWGFTLEVSIIGV
jgi:hypothetical protein